MSIRGVALSMVCLSSILLVMVAPSLQRSTFDRQDKDISETSDAASVEHVSMLQKTGSEDMHNDTVQTRTWNSDFCDEGYGCGCCYGSEGKSAAENQYHCYALQDSSNCCYCGSS
ncbi:hypothetical protein Mapa_012930 [Marchantia paleacea]|nr:hypothetical protein Mapa_012930 [Marchantia paleacea]